MAAQGPFRHVGPFPEPQHRSRRVEERVGRVGIALPFPHQVDVQSDDLVRDARWIGRDQAESEPDHLFRIHPPHPDPREAIADERRVVERERAHDRRMREAPARPRQGRRGQHQPGRRRTIDGCLQDRDHAAHGVSDEHHAPSGELPDEPGHHPTFVHQPRASAVPWRPAEAGQVEREDPAQAGEPGRDLEPVQVGPAQPVDQDERGLGGPLPGSVADGPVQVDGGELGKVDRHVREPRGTSRRSGAFSGKGTACRARRHKTFTCLRLYICHRDALPYVRAAAKASLYARLHSCGHLSYRVPEDRRGCSPATTRPRGGE